MTGDELSDLVNGLSDQAAVWESIIRDRPAIVPSATIAAAQADARTRNLASVASDTAPVLTYLASSPVGLMVGAGVVLIVIVLLLRK